MTVRYLIKFSKEGGIKFISHLDLMRTLQKIIKRAGLPIDYSKGFNPHMALSIAQPLSVGMYSKGEYMDVVLIEELKEEYIKFKLNESSPMGIKFLEVVKVADTKPNEKRTPQSMAAVDAAKYVMKIKYNDAENIVSDIKKLSQLKEWNIVKKSKSGEKEVNIKPLVKEFKFKVEDNCLNIQALVACGSKENLSAELLATFIQNNTDNPNLEAFVDVEREEMYGLLGDKLVPLYQYIK